MDEKPKFDGSRIKEARERRGMSVKDVSQITGISVATLYRYENGDIASMPATKLKPIADALGVKPGELIGWKDDKAQITQHGLPVVPGRDLVFYEQPPVMVQVIGSVRCGEGGLAVQEFDGEEPANVDHPENYFYLRASGDSMEPRIFDGDLVLVRQQDDVESGEIAVVVVDGEEGTLKRVIKKPGIVVLEPFNHAHETRYFAGAEMAKIRIVGKAVKVEGRL